MKKTKTISKKANLTNKSKSNCPTNHYKILIFLAILFGALGGGITTYILTNYHEPTQNELMKEFYDVENAVHISPHGIRKHLGEDDTYILVDLRSAEEYEDEHIRGAINIPAYKDKDHSDYGAIERIVGEFSQLSKDKEIIVYCYSIPCMTGRKIGKILADHDIYVKQLGVGWNEWRYYWDLWNHPHEWEITNVEDYIWSGKEPGPPMVEKVGGASCPIESDVLGC